MGSTLNCFGLKYGACVVKHSSVSKCKTKAGRIFGSFQCAVGKNMIRKSFILLVFMLFYLDVGGAFGEKFNTMDQHDDINECNISHFYNQEYRAIQLNVSFWSPNVQKTDDIYLSIVTIQEKCDVQGKPISHRKRITNETIYIIPEPDDLFSLDPGCAYMVNIPGHCASNYSLPECVGEMCNCAQMSSDVSIDAKHDNGMINLNWTVHNNYTLREIQFRILHNNSASSDLYVNASLKDMFPQIGSIHVKMPKMEVFKNVLEIEGLFLNEHRCSEFSKALLYIQRRDDDAGKLSVYVAVFILLSVFVAVIALFILINRRNIFNTYGIEQQNMFHMNRMPLIPIRRAEANNILYTPSDPTDLYEFPQEKLTIIKELDRGAFGIVYLAKAINIRSNPGYTYIAVKTLRDRSLPEEKEDFLFEIQTLKKIGQHNNIVLLLGYCTKDKYMMLMEFVPCGSLRKYLVELRNKWADGKTNVSDRHNYNSDCSYIEAPDSPASFMATNNNHTFQRSLSNGNRRQSNSTDTSVLTTCTPLSDTFNYTLECVLDHRELQNFGLQIARGMSHLEQIQITHRDLAARNVLISQYKVLKISDFGMSRSGAYINKKSKIIPLRWMAIEAIADNFNDSKSDVWSFGVVLWEIGTLGALPYKNTRDELILHNLLNGHRLERPEICTDYLHHLMLRCWEHDPNKRPTFSELVDLLDFKTQNLYVEFSQLNPTYVFPN